MSAYFIFILYNLAAYQLISFIAKISNSIGINHSHSQRIPNCDRPTGNFDADVWVTPLCRWQFGRSNTIKI
ncbi:hypothetical protein QUB05_05960 [Microcoleus sp. F10-C6]|uniref:hypothetical protein n=1 Tax=unclassified Microcoleus TaxID=2642155 RepID=UPI002FD75215